MQFKQTWLRGKYRFNEDSIKDRQIRCLRKYMSTPRELYALKHMKTNPKSPVIYNYGYRNHKNRYKNNLQLRKQKIKYIKRENLNMLYCMRHNSGEFRAIAAKAHSSFQLSIRKALQNGITAKRQYSYAYKRLDTVSKYREPTYDKLREKLLNEVKT